jgi:hypothetical protein
LISVVDAQAKSEGDLFILWKIQLQEDFWRSVGAVASLVFLVVF